MRESTAVLNEKRREPRLPVALAAHCRLGDHYVRETLGDLSLCGLYLKTGEAAREGMEVRIALALPYVDGPRFCTLVGNVARVERDETGRISGLGVSFDEHLDRFDRDLLRGFLALWASRKVGRA